MVANYRVIAALWLALWLFAWPQAASADSVRVGDFVLAADAAWQRASAEEERERGNVVLRQDGGLEVYLPLRQTHLKVTPDTFFSRLENTWRKRYGDKASLDWLDLAGTRWRVCRRPSLDGPSVVFQLVTLRGDLAYQVVVVAPPGSTVLPEPAVRLLTQATWANAPGDAR